MLLITDFYKYFHTANISPEALIFCLFTSSFTMVLPGNNRLEFLVITVLKILTSLAMFGRETREIITHKQTHFRCFNLGIRKYNLWSLQNRHQGVGKCKHCYSYRFRIERKKKFSKSMVTRVPPFVLLKDKVT